MAELAQVIGKSVKALQEEIRNDPDFPIVSRGAQGVAYEFDLDEVIPHRRAKHDRVTAAEEARRQELRQWRLDFYGEEPEDDRGLTPAERKVEAEAVKVEDYNRARRDELFEKWKVAEKLRRTFGTLQKRMRQVASEFARETGLERAQRIVLDNMIREHVNAAIDQAQELLRGEHDDEGENADRAA